MTLQKPPKQKKAAGLAGRFIGLLVLLAGFALVVWTAATMEQIAALERSDPFVHAPGEHVSARGGVLHVRSFGSGSTTTVLFHHDNVAGGAPLSGIAEGLVDQDRTVLVPDLVGFGFSSRPAEAGRHLSTSGQADTVIEWLDGRGGASVELVGFGWGGEVATEVTVLRPDLVSRLVLVDVVELPVPPPDMAWLEAMPFNVGQAVAHAVEGASDQAHADYTETCPSWADCSDPEILEERRRAASIPGTARAISARRATAPASVAGSRLDEIELTVEMVAVDAARQEVETLAARFPSAEVTTATPATLAQVLSP